MTMQKLKDCCAERGIAFLALMLVSPLATASDFRGFITIFLGFPSLVFSNLALGVLLLGFYLRSRKWRLLLLVPLSVLTLLLALCVAAISGMFVLQGLGPDGGWQSLVMFLAMVSSFFVPLVTVVLLFRARSSSYEQGSRRRAAWAAVTLAFAVSFPVIFDLQALMRKDGSDWPLMGGYAVLFAMALILHGLVLWLPSAQRAAR